MGGFEKLMEKFHFEVKCQNVSGKCLQEQMLN